MAVLCSKTKTPATFDPLGQSESFFYHFENRKPRLLTEWIHLFTLILLVILPLVGQPQPHPTHVNTVDNKSALLLIILIPRPI